MNKKIMLDKRATIFFFFNILVFLSAVIFNFIYTKMNYYNPLVKSIFIFNVAVLFIGFIYNMLLLFGKKHDIKKIIILMLVVHLLLNVILINLVNNRYNDKYYNISKDLLKYCKLYNCDKYETTYLDDEKDFIIYKHYYDYNNLRNEIEIHTIYNTSKIINVKAIIYSDNELFSEQLIFDELNDYFLNFNIYINSEMIRKAFINRDKGNIKENNINYKVNSIYKSNSLDKFQTIISAKL